MKEKVISFAISLSMIVSCATIGTVASQAKTINSGKISNTTLKNSVVGTNNYSLANNIQDGVILHCFDWKYNDIKADLQSIAEAGFTSIQTSPPQANNNHGVWYWLYQPKNFEIGTNDLGSKAELESLCTEADKYGIKIVCDVVANHLQGSHSNIDSELKDSKYWHDLGKISDWKDRYQVTHGTIGMPDIKTEDSFVQSKVKKYVQELKSVGVDGLRWDAAKHIGLPSEGDDFWKVVTTEGLYNYGEILNEPGGDANTIMKEYTDYISVTDNSYGDTVLSGFKNKHVTTSSSNWASKGIDSNKILYWAESHDTYSNGGTGTQYLDQNLIDRAYATVAAKNDATSLYFSRPFEKEKKSIMAGVKGSTHFTSKEVSAVNQFHNAMIGKDDYYTSSNGCAVITRKDGGAVIVKGSGNGKVSVTNGGGYAKSGTYIDQVSGGTFTVDGSTISGDIGSSGIAVIYNTSSSSLVLMGDANEDGKVTIIDVTLIQKYLTGKSTLSEYGLKASAVLEDDININDCTAIQKYLSGKSGGGTTGTYL